MRELRALQDANLLEFAHSLTAADWAAPSACAGWTAKDVLAHLALGLHLPTGRLLAEIVRRRGSFDAANDVLSRRHASEREVGELIEEFDRHRHRPRGIGRLFPQALLLGDHTVHHIDIALGLGRPADLDPAVADAVLRLETSLPNPFVPAKARSSGLRLVAVDTGWAHGAVDAPQVRGSAPDLIAALAGRAAALGALTGDGVGVLAARVAPTAPAPPGPTR
jgi:uncharacterized protein (TIGR03083 family)